MAASIGLLLMSWTVVITFYTLDRSTPLMARMTRPSGIRILYVVSLIKINIFSIFYPKMWKIALRPMATSKSYNSGTFEDTCTLFEPIWGFSGRPIEWCASNLPLTHPCRHGNQSPLFEHKIGNNSACMGDTTPFLHLIWVIGVGEFICASEICARPTPVAIATKICKF